MTSELSPVARLWPFGKYQGQAIERVMADHSYMEWVLAQPWFAEDYPKIHQLIVNFGSEVQDSPEHNEFQMRFLDDRVRLAVARRIGFQELDGEISGKRKAIARRVARELNCAVQERELSLGVSAVRFEDQGWDVSFEIRPASYAAWVDAASRGKDYIELLERWGMVNLATKTKARLRDKHATLDVAVYEPNSSRRPKVMIELKPDLGDDYPSVLRQIQRYPSSSKERAKGRGKIRSSDRKLLIVRRARFTTVSYEQVKAFFKSADIALLMEWELEIPETVDELTGVVEEAGEAEAAANALRTAAEPTDRAAAEAADGTESSRRGSRRVLEPVGIVAVGATGSLETVYSESSGAEERLSSESALEEEWDEVEDFFGTDDDVFEEIDPELLD